MSSREARLFRLCGSETDKQVPDHSIECIAEVMRRLATLPGSSEAIAKNMPSEILLVRLRWPGRGEALRASIGLGVQRRMSRSGKAVHKPQLGRRLDALLAYFWPEASLSAASEQPPRLSTMQRLRPLPATAITRPRAGPRDAAQLGPGTDDLLCERLDTRRFDLTAALAVLKTYNPSELVMRVSPVALDARDLRAVQSAIAGQMAAAMARRTVPGHGEALLPFLQALQGSGRGVLIETFIRLAATQDNQAALDLLSLALFGASSDPDEPTQERADFRCMWPVGWELPQLLPTDSEARALADKVPISTRRGRSRAQGTIFLGRASTGERIDLSPRDRARHVYVIGATGTGKSTLLLNLIRQDMMAGEGVIVIDPHGDLADAARHLVPDQRYAQLTWADLSDPDSRIGLNILQGQGRAAELDRNYVCNQLITLFRRVLYQGVPEAFGPMWESYFRNGLMLLMDGGGPQASLMDFERVFYDKMFRSGLIKRCSDAKVREFWLEVAEKATDEEIRLENIAPYIVSKLTQLTGNPLVRRFIGAGSVPLDLRRIMDRGEIALIKFARGLVGDYDAMLIASLIAIRLGQASMGRASLPAEARRPVRVYIDEFQLCACDALHDMLAETRKYGVSLTLANQSLSQVDGRRDRSDAGHAVLANVANIVALRLGAPDAAKLAPWFAPDVEWPEICRLPDFQGVVRALDNGRPVPARMMRLDPPS